jgi:hypothetical protein
LPFSDAIDKWKSMKAMTRINKLNQTLELLNMNGYTTTAPVFAGNCADLMPEFGRFRDVERLFGIKRGTVYNLIAEGHVKSVVLRRKGNITGCRLIYLKSVSDYLHRLMSEQNGQMEMENEAGERDGRSQSLDQ